MWTKIQREQTAELLEAAVQVSRGSILFWHIHAVCWWWPSSFRRVVLFSSHIYEGIYYIAVSRFANMIMALNTIGQPCKSLFR